MLSFCGSRHVPFGSDRSQLAALRHALESILCLVVFQASGDTSAAISQVNVQIQYNKMTIHARKIRRSYSALCTLVEEEWPFLTAIDYIFGFHIEHDNVQFDSEVYSNRRQATLANCAMLIRICAHHQAGSTQTVGGQWGDETESLQFSQGLFQLH